MDLTIEDVATRLGKTARQVRYMIKMNRLRARKIGGAYFVADADLPLSDGQVAAQSRKAERLLEVADAALAPATAAAGTARRYSVRDLKAWQIAQPLHTSAAAGLGADHPATKRLYAALRCLARGCHRFDRDEKAAAYREARDHASDATTDLLLAKHAEADAVAHTLEQELMPAMAGLIRRLERRRR